jgi:hypothetical protein
MTRNPRLPFAVLAAEPAGGGFALTSPDIADGAVIDRKFSYEGENISPELRWSEPPAGTKSFALLVHDPDAPTGGAGFWHWLVVNIPADVRSLKQGPGRPDAKTLPAGVRLIRSDYGFSHWGGPCPPVGDPPHRYVFTIYALGVETIDAPADATASMVGFLVNAKTLAKASFIGLYKR